MRSTRLPAGAARASATLTALAVLLLALPAGLALAASRTKSCAHIDNCSTVVNSPAPPPTAIPGAKPSPTSRFGLAVRTPPTSSATMRQQSGKLVTNPQLGRRIRCAGYRLRAPNTFEFQLLTATPVNITYEITDKITNTTAQGVEFCLAATFAFKTLSGRPAPARRLPDGTRGHIGLLPTCARPLPPAGAASAPCVEQITTAKDSNSSTGVDVIIKARVPTRTKGDPWGGG